ncbi:TPA: hypothetical protein OMH10_000589 [Enterococcus faecalis]|nr:hypothetical protein [Enterococcus faecalis]
MELLQNPVFCLFIIVAIYALGDFISTKTKAWIPSVVVVATLFLIGFWTILPKDIIDRAGIGAPLGGIVVIMLAIAHLGTTISFQELKLQWKSVVVSLAGLLGMVVVVWGIGGLFLDKNYLVVGIPSITGGVVSATLMQEAASAIGLTKPALLAICIYVMQGFAGYPLSTIFLKREARRILKQSPILANNTITKNDIQPKNEDQLPQKKLFPSIPDKYYTTALSLAKMAIVCILAYIIQTLTVSWGAFKLNQAVVVLILSIFATKIGFLEENILKKNGTYHFIMLVLLISVFAGLNVATPEMLIELAFPLIVIIVLGVIGGILGAGIAGKFIGVSFDMSSSIILVAIYGGFPQNYILTEEASKAVSDSKEEQKYLVDTMVPQMLVGGFTSVTITSVIISGIFTSFLG